MQIESHAATVEAAQSTCRQAHWTTADARGFRAIRCASGDDREALVQSGVADVSNFTSVALLEKQGRYARRRVTFFRAFEPGHQGLLLGSQHVEPDGLDVVTNLRPPQESNAPARELANRSHHADDERLVCWDAAAAGSSVAKLSGPAATWLYAQSNSEEHQR